MISLDFSSMTVGDFIAIVKDVTIGISVLTLGWKARALIQPVIDFFKTASSTMRRANQHMFAMEAAMNTLLTNHVAHIEKDLASLVGRRIVNHERVEQTVLQVTEVPSEDASQV